MGAGEAGTTRGDHEVTTYLTINELDVEDRYGVPVAWIGEDGDAVAFTENRRRGLAAIHSLGRTDLGGPCAVTGDIQQTWMRFYLPEGGHSDEWVGDFCRPDQDGAIQVVIAEGVSDRASLAFVAREAS